MSSGTYKVSVKGSNIDSPTTDSAIDLMRRQRRSRRLSWKTKIFYSVGHIYNDLCASVWFSYTLLFFQLDFQSNLAGSLLLLGQVADAIATPLIGFESDRNHTSQWLCRYGKRKAWHLAGTVLVSCSFPFIFNACIGCGDATEYAKFAYYSAFIVIFQIGWASVQVSHVSLITDLTRVSSERVELNAYRQASTVASSICVYTVTWLILQGKGDSSIKKEDSVAFTNVVYIISGIGLTFSILFHIFVRENSTPELEEYSKNMTYRQRISSETLSVHSSLYDSDNNNKCYNPTASAQSLPSTGAQSYDEAKWSDWFSNFNFYKVGFIYMMSRLFVNLTQVYTPLYLQDTLQLPKKSIAIIPFATYISGFFCSLLTTKIISDKINSKILLIIGCLFGLSSCLWIWFGPLDPYSYKQWQIYGVAIAFGIGGTIMLITSLAIVSDLIGNNITSAAFVFGVMSFLDKLVNGITVAVLEQFNSGQSSMPSETDLSLEPDLSEPVRHYQHILIFVCGAAVVFAFIGLVTVLKGKVHEPQDHCESCCCGRPNKF